MQQAHACSELRICKQQQAYLTLCWKANQPLALVCESNYRGGGSGSLSILNDFRSLHSHTCVADLTFAHADDACACCASGAGYM